MNWLLQKIKGSEFKLDDKISTLDTLYILITYTIQLTRGLIFQNRLCFLGKNVTIKHSKNLELGKWCKFQEFVHLDCLASSKVIFGNNLSIGAYSRIEVTGTIKDLGKGLKIGNNCGIGAFSYLGSAGGISIGNDVIMGQYVSFHSENHNFNLLDRPIRSQGVNRQGIIISNDCWVGAKVTFLDGSNIGAGCVIAAGSVVRGHFPSNSIIGGVPAKVIRQRDIHKDEI